MVFLVAYSKISHKKMNAMLHKEKGIGGKTKKILKIAGILMAGIFIGAVIMNLLHMYVRSTYRQTIQIEFINEQEVLAARSIRNDDKLGAVLHRWAVEEAGSLEGFRIFRKDKQHKDTDMSFLLPFYLLSSKVMWSSQEAGIDKGSKIVEGINRGKLAVALESIGEKEEANRQWARATTLTRKKSTEDTRALVLRLLEQDKTSAYLELERAILR
ncbi:MAG: hypothetical protein HY754_05130 [Nitrospirae bacterium]|nr:hypothetical protein [Nitrospirota bacterium]